MRRLVSLTLAGALAAGLLAAPLPAQEPVPLAPYLGLSLGVSRPPAAIQDPCGPRGRLAAVDVLAGVERGRVTVEARGSAHVPTTEYLCPAAPLTRPDGIHTDLQYPFERGAPLTGDLRVRYAPPVPGGVGLGGGAGWAWPQKLPYLVVGAELRAPGRVRPLVEVERSWFRVPADALTLEWRDHRVVREISRERRRDWQGGWGVRAGLAFAFR